ncbi:hypothetical protein E2562_016235 [Oryza meyeriana var. granulata]|uniref:Uncharacterized protein n=1 Tax=Oryza meyeriana var. granulata TaxID=110450 RepID=A0A6G1CQI6_9ORYZ|nr:hypothetical protein E2562_016235 [Oryza meyeriana var. granulata]
MIGSQWGQGNRETEVGSSLRAPRACTRGGDPGRWGHRVSEGVAGVGVEAGACGGRLDDLAWLGARG